MTKQAGWANGIFLPLCRSRPSSHDPSCHVSTIARVQCFNFHETKDFAELWKASKLLSRFDFFSSFQYSVLRTYVVSRYGWGGFEGVRMIITYFALHCFSFSLNAMFGRTACYGVRSTLSHSLIQTSRIPHISQLSRCPCRSTLPRFHKTLSRVISGAALLLRKLSVSHQDTGKWAKGMVGHE